MTKIAGCQSTAEIVDLELDTAAEAGAAAETIRWTRGRPLWRRQRWRSSAPITVDSRPQGYKNRLSQARTHIAINTRQVFPSQALIVERDQDDDGRRLLNWLLCCMRMISYGMGGRKYRSIEGARPFGEVCFHCYVIWYPGMRILECGR